MNLKMLLFASVSPVSYTHLKGSYTYYLVFKNGGLGYYTYKGDKFTSIHFVDYSINKNKMCIRDSIWNVSLILHMAISVIRILMMCALCFMLLRHGNQAIRQQRGLAHNMDCLLYTSNGTRCGVDASCGRSCYRSEGGRRYS